jgi:hypothetical protein
MASRPTPRRAESDAISDRDLIEQHLRSVENELLLGLHADPEALADIDPFLRAEHFVSDEARSRFLAFRRLASAGRPTGPLDVEREAARPAAESPAPQPRRSGEVGNRRVFDAAIKLHDFGLGDPAQTWIASFEAPADSETDFTAWCIQQAALIEAVRPERIDVAAVVEEIRDLGRAERKSLRSALEVVLVHLLKWDHQSWLRSRSWALSVEEHRRRIDDTLIDNPSLEPRLGEFSRRAYERARRRAALETRLDISTFPEQCPYSEDELRYRPLLDDGDEE